MIDIFSRLSFTNPTHTAGLAINVYTSMKDVTVVSLSSNILTHRVSQRRTVSELLRRHVTDLRTTDWSDTHHHFDGHWRHTRRHSTSIRNSSSSSWPASALGRLAYIRVSCWCCNRVCPFTAGATRSHKNIRFHSQLGEISASSYARRRHYCATNRPSTWLVGLSLPPRTASPAHFTHPHCTRYSRLVAIILDTLMFIKTSHKIQNIIYKQ